MNASSQIIFISCNGDVSWLTTGDYRHIYANSRFFFSKLCAILAQHVKFWTSKQRNPARFTSKFKKLLFWKIFQYGCRKPSMRNLHKAIQRATTSVVQTCASSDERAIILGPIILECQWLELMEYEEVIWQV